MRRLLAVIQIVVVALIGLGAMVVLMLWLAGVFTPKIKPTPPGKPAPATSASSPKTLVVHAQNVETFREASGAIQAEHQIAVASKLLAKVLEVRVAAGAHVAAADLLVLLDDTAPKAALEQAEAGLAQAQDDYNKVMRLRDSRNATAREVTQYTNALQAARAARDQAKAVWDDTRILAPADGIVIDKYCEAGDTVSPGQVVVRLFDRLQLNATVPESLRDRLDLGQAVNVRIDAIGRACQGTVAEIVPQAEQNIRSFQVKVIGPCQAGVMLGMFGRLRIPTGSEPVIRIPASAVERVGQITRVWKMVDGRPMRQFVQLGPEVDGHVTVTSGLADGDQIVVNAAEMAPSAAP